MAQAGKTNEMKPPVARKQQSSTKKESKMTTKVTAVKREDLAKKPTRENEDVTVAVNVIVFKRSWDAEKLYWRHWEVVLSKDSPAGAKFAIPLPSGGALSIYPGLLSEERQRELEQELCDANLFRQYASRGAKEPRAHFLLHEEATTTDENFDTSMQPGYKYGSTTLKSRPLSLLPKLQELSRELLVKCGVDSWNIGINPVCYRDDKDHIGSHSDNNQGEDKIMTAVLKSPGIPRIVIIENKSGGEKGNGKKGAKFRQEGDEQYLLNLGAGDAYDMDGEMQKHYVHSVKKSSSTKTNEDPDEESATKTKENQRLVVVFRHGTFALCTRDSGEPLENLEPRKDMKQTFGRMDALVEGDLYSRQDLFEVGAHNAQERGISGNASTGCDAIIVSGAREDGLGEDLFDRLMYAAETKKGGGALLLNMKKRIPIRVFRSSSGKNSTAYKAMPSTKGKSAKYRYDGLYEIKSVTFHEDTGVETTETPDCLSNKVVGRLYKFHLERLPAGSDIYANEKTAHKLMEDSSKNGTIGMEAAAKFAKQSPAFPLLGDGEGRTDNGTTCYSHHSVHGPPSLSPKQGIYCRFDPMSHLYALHCTVLIDNEEYSISKYSQQALEENS